MDFRAQPASVCQYGLSSNAEQPLPVPELGPGFALPQTVSVQHLLGFGAPLGRTDQQWAAIFTTAIRAMKKLGVR